MMQVRCITPNLVYNCPKCKGYDVIRLTLDIDLANQRSRPRFECVNCGYETGLVLWQEANAVVPQGIFGHMRKESAWGRQKSY